MTQTQSSTGRDPRGRYDRSLAPALRATQQRERLLQSCATCLASGRALTVASVTRGAGLGRNALYLHFGDVPDLVDALLHGCATSLVAGLDSALTREPTPRSALLACALTWLRWTAEDPARARAVAAVPRPQVEPIRTALRGALDECLRRGRSVGLLSREADAVAIAIALGALFELGMQCAEARLEPELAATAWVQCVVLTCR
jgi:AcrR family transcriptional regulator